MTGSYITADGGNSWRMFNLGAMTRFFEWDPRNPKVIYAGANALYRSSEGGVSWKRLYPPARDVTSIEMIDDSGVAAFVVNSNRQRITALAVDFTRSDILFAGFGRTLKVSQDTGATWQSLREFPTNIRRIWGDRGSLYVASERSLDVMKDGAWHEVTTVPTPWTEIAGGPPVLYAIRDGAGAVSEDGGESWRNLALPGASGRFVAIAASNRRPDTVYVLRWFTDRRPDVVRRG
jgi:hypothetical protein